ncbi:flagellar motor switch protein FliN [Oribacterium sp. WCC10]|uniref:flagellar motor switch protein FliN n=1 Tax=Oribacterium sp. WCC10 TaxID=1855343 RepID=UPI0008EB2708|nr:flagellar motor switch protein FliN [Oribacterium sp. WCC10]SFG24902.1 flagellar motor switch protein FliN/FliY [Oribacterium sp. WCC10]
MGADRFNSMEIDAIGEIMNISLGSSATALSTMLGTKVNITTPVVKVQNRTEFEYRELEPAVGVEISYVKGLDGRNVMMFSRNDVRIIVSMMMGMDIPEDEFVMDEMNASAIREVMNQMMGSSATALSEFLGVTVDISTPVSFEVPNEEEFKDKYFPGDEAQVVVCFTLEIEDKELESEFLNIMSVSLVRRLLQPFAEQFGIELSEGADEAPAEAASPAEEPAAAAPASSGGQLDQSAVDALLNGGGGTPEPAPAPASSGGQLDQSSIDALLNGGGGTPAPAPAPAPTPAPAPAPQPAAAAPPPPAPAPMPAPAPVPAAAPAAQAPQYVQAVAGAPDPMTLQLLNQMQQSQTQMMQLIKDIEEDRKASKNQPRPGVKIQSLNSPEYGESEDYGEQEENKEMLMKVPLEISVEIGRTKKLVKDILEFTQGSLVVLDKMAGEQADLYVNGECIARGDIVVVEDNFGIRITEIVSKEINPESL